MDDQNNSDARLDKGMQAAFGGRGRRGVHEAIERKTGVSSRVLLRDDPEENSPILKLGASGDDTMEGDSRYRIVGEIARGGVGVLFKGRDGDLGRDVALKVLRSDLAEHPEIIQRFIEEAQIEGQLQHPGIVPVYGLGLQSDGRPYFAMKLVKGRTLAALLAERKEREPELPTFLPIFEQVCQAVAYAHARGVIHRDLKPSNILVGAFGEVLVVDWGLAKVLDQGGDFSVDSPLPMTTVIATVRSQEGSSHSLAGSVMGTPAYMPPEQALGHVGQIDERSDVFSLGAVLTEILTGQPPYVGETRDPLVLASQAKLDDALARLDGCGAPKDLTALAKRCLSPMSADRPANASRVTEEITGYLAAVEERARRAEIEAVEEKGKLAVERRRVVFERRARRRTLAVAGIILIAVVAGAASLLYAQRRTETRREQAATRMARAMERATELRSNEMWIEALVEMETAIEAAPDEDARTRSIALRNEIEGEKQTAEETAQRKVRDDILADRVQEIRDLYNDERRQIGIAGICRKKHEDYLRAFRDWGLDIDALDVEQVSRRIRNSTRMADIVDGLDGWSAGMLLYVPGEEATQEKLLALTRAADPDPWRGELRRANLIRDYAALRQLAESARLSDLSPRKIAQVAGLLLETDNHDACTDLLERALTRWPGDKYLQKYQGMGHMQEGRWEEAVRCFTAALTQTGKGAVLLGRQAAALSNTGRWMEALATFERSLDLDPESPWVWGDYGMDLSELGRYPDAVRALDRAIDLNPEHPKAYYSRGIVHQALGKLEEALGDYRRHAEIDDTHPGCHNNRGAILNGGLGRYEEAKAEFEAAIARAEGNPNLPDYWCNLGNALWNLNELETATEAFRSACDLRGNARELLCLAQLLRLTGKHEEALTILRKALAVDPHYSNARYEEALVLALLDRSEDALTAARRGVDLDPTFAPLLKTLAWQLEQRGRYDLALCRYREARRYIDRFPALKREVEEELRTCLLKKKLSPRLPAILENPKSVTGAEELQALAMMCYAERRHAAAAEFMVRLVETLGDSAKSEQVRNLAVFAALPGRGRGVDAPEDPVERARWRAVCLYNLRRVLAMARAESDLSARTMMLGLREDGDIAFVRKEEELLKLPPEEQEAFRDFWAEVEAWAGGGE